MSKIDWRVPTLLMAGMLVTIKARSKVVRNTAPPGSIDALPQSKPYIPNNTNCDGPTCQPPDMGPYQYNWE
jgi:hypothetical protein